MCAYTKSAPTLNSPRPGLAKQYHKAALSMIAIWVWALDSKPNMAIIKLVMFTFAAHPAAHFKVS